jgi:hypothetical protein
LILARSAISSDLACPPFSRHQHSSDPAIETCKDAITKSCGWSFSSVLVHLLNPSRIWAVRRGGKRFVPSCFLADCAFSSMEIDAIDIWVSFIAGLDQSGSKRCAIHQHDSTAHLTVWLLLCYSVEPDLSGSSNMLALMLLFTSPPPCRYYGLVVSGV